MKPDALDRYSPLFAPPERSFDGFERRRDRKRRNQKIGALALALVIAVAAVGGALIAFRASRGIPANPSITQQNLRDLDVAWTASVGGQPSGLYNAFGPLGGLEPFPPTLAGDEVYVGTWDGTIYAFPASCASDGATCQPAWVADAAAGIPFAPTVAGGTVYVGTWDGRLIAYPADCGTGGSTCSPSWVADTGHTLAASPVVADGLVFGIDPQGGTLYAFPADCGTERAECGPTWTASIHTGPCLPDTPCRRQGNESGQVFAPTVANGVVYAPSFGQGAPDRLFAFDERTGRQLWVAQVAAKLDTSPVLNVPVVSGGLVFEVFKSRLYAFPEGCRPVAGVCHAAWSVGTNDLGEGDVVMNRAVASGDAVYVKTWENEGIGNTYSFRIGPCATPCKPVWKMHDDGFGDLLVANGIVYSTSLHAGYVDTAPVDCDTGGRSCSHVGRLNAFEGPEPPTAGDGVAYWGTENGTVYGVPSDCTKAGYCGDEWQWSGGSEPVSSPAVADSMLFVVSRDGTVTAFAVGASRPPGLSKAARKGAALFYGALVLGIGATLAVRARRRRRI